MCGVHKGKAIAPEDTSTSQFLHLLLREHHTGAVEIIRTRIPKVYRATFSPRKWLHKQDHDIAYINRHVNMEGEDFCEVLPQIKNYRELQPNNNCWKREN